ncbi:2OG-Fe(II) oxygenase [Silanimonas sp.]|uniref:2OG-Fe(II) oxygenase n=1 Tax=Silanimonas sp. TaxID=1929290 RepID=UPI0022BAB0EF|nr:2OG-Fe(II) oxygenase [Silanimonas sp.]MCZ8114529.1 2OG-Fe(II) oxygenase [Silanimonas sp.]
MDSAHPDFIEVYEGLIDPAWCAALCRRFDAANHVDGRVGGGVFPDMKKSRDLEITGRADWNDVSATLMGAVLKALMAYLRTYPHTIVAPLMLEHRPADGGPARRLGAEDLAAMDDNSLLGLVQQLLRPGSINLQRYTAGEGGYPYWHCELYPRDANSETLHRTLLWTIYLNDAFDEGETEFLYQRRKVVPKTGSVLIAPTAFTHTHRGNRPVGGDKYIATSWILFNRAEAIFGRAG